MASETKSVAGGRRENRRPKMVGQEISEVIVVIVDRFVVECGIKLKV